MLDLLLSAIVAVEPGASLSLDRCKALARANAAEVQEARYEEESAVQTRRSAFTKLLPQVSATAGAMKAMDPLVDVGTNSATNLPVYDGNPANLGSPTQFAFVPPISLQAAGAATIVSLDARQTLFAGGRVVNGNRLAALGVEVAGVRRSLAERDAAAQAEDKYWTLSGLAQTRRTLDAYDTLLGSLQKQVEDAVRSGVASRNDRLKVSLERSRLRVHRTELDNGARLAARDLRRLLGLEDDTVLALSDTLPEPRGHQELEARRAGAVDRRLESKLLANGVEAERLQGLVEAGAMMPVVAVGVSAQRVDVDGLEPFDDVVVYGLASIAITEAWGGWHEASVRRAKQHAAQVREIDTRRLLALGVEKEWGDLNAAWEACAAAEDALAQADENVAVESDRHRSGIGSLSDLLEAQAMRQKSLEERVEARRNYWLRRSAFLRATGGLD